MNITSFLLYCFVVTFTPGPTNIVILSTVHNHGTKKAMEYTYGATIAFCLLLAAMSGLIMQFVNPKVLLFTMTVMPSFVMPHYSALPAVTISVIAITLIGFLAFTTWVLFGTIFKQFLGKHEKSANVMMSIFLIYAAIMIWM